MSKQHRCSHCGFVGYPEIAREESVLKNLLMYYWSWLLWHIFKRQLLSYKNWDDFTNKKYLRCPKCKRTDCMLPIEDTLSTLPKDEFHDL